MNSHQESGLSKSVWSDADFEDMGWHDATVHGLHVQQTDDILPRLLLDLDYIVRWVHPVRPAKTFSFWVAPATLVFEQVWDLEGGLGFKDMHPELEIADVHRLVPDDGKQDWQQWHIEGHLFDLKFRASGFRQYFRHAPRLMPGPVLPIAERGGCCFTEVGFA
ncbi:hypothetical protein SAMN05216371_3164 [Streptomyces sp. TLI_053]|uniref:hypothetical protein n=1 Tax=Streptomyces sp. TLI_053 TaxID=1855352 RepID=UPI00087C3B13|nr:hypothetical protein [Streptomyces sp. TLI_053]SDT61525.1 hypothetical protein SAMN05216371_3164 [Streptomyces sp. TLI_053]